MVPSFPSLPFHPRPAAFSFRIPGSYQNERERNETSNENERRQKREKKGSEERQDPYPVKKDVLIGLHSIHCGDNGGDI